MDVDLRELATTYELRGQWDIAAEIWVEAGCPLDAAACRMLSVLEPETVKPLEGN